MAIRLFVVVTSLLSAVVTRLEVSNAAGGYEGITLFPIVFVLAYLVFLGRVPISQSKAPILQVIFSFIQWLRFVVMPPAIAVSGTGAGTDVVQPSADSVSTATLMMIIELIVTSAVVGLLVARRSGVRGIPVGLRLEGSPLVYVGFILFALAVGIWASGREQILYFLVLPDGDGRVGDIVDTSLVIARQIILVALFVVFMAVASRNARMEERKGGIHYVLLPLAFGLLNVSLIVGERRSAQLLTGVCAALILYSTFPKYRRFVTVAIGSLAASILVSMTIYKSFGSTSASYVESLLGIDVSTPWVSQQLQAYFSGPQVTAAVLESKSYILSAGGSGMFDVLRSTVPVSFLVKDSGAVTSVLFNSYLYNGGQATGQVVSAIGWGYLYLGPWLFWLAPVINLLIAYAAERALARSTSLESLYIAGYILVRCAVNVTANPPALLSGTSIMLATGGLLCWLAQRGRAPNLQRRMTS